MKTVKRHLDEMRATEVEAAPARVEVLLLHLGGPGSEEEIEEHHLALWSEAAIAPGLMRRSRAEKQWQESGEDRRMGYALIGGRSPVGDLLGSQALALQNHLNGRPVMAVPAPGEARVRTAALFGGAPSLGEALAAAAGAERIVAVPMYPLPCPSLDGVLREALAREAKERGVQGRLSVVAPFDEDPLFRRAMEERTKRSLDLIPPELRGEAHLLFALHSPPKGSDARRLYLERAEALAQAVLAATGLPEERSGAGFQHFGAPVKHLEPSILDLAVERAQAGVRAMVIAPLSFVTDAFETLHHLDIEVFKAATEAGGKQVRRVPTLNADPLFIEMLAENVLGALPSELAGAFREAGGR